MPTMFAVVLRIVLCLALVTSGLADAVASVRSSAAQAAHAVADAAVQPSPCHGQTRVAGDESTLAARSVPDGTAAPSDGGASGDCCPGGSACPCECAVTLHATLPPSPPHAQPGRSPAEPAVRSPGRLAPALPHPIRPPIG